MALQVQEFNGLFTRGLVEITNVERQLVRLSIVDIKGERVGAGGFQRAQIARAVGDGAGEQR
jgi:hypothetical protein